MSAKPKAGDPGQAAALPNAQQTPLPSHQQTQGERSRAAVLIERLPVLLACLLAELSTDAGDNPATVVLAGIALEHSHELQALTEDAAP
jgi:hypothetical protein